MLKYDLQFFAGEDDLDLDSMLQEFENEWTEEESDTEDVPAGPEGETETEEHESEESSEPETPTQEDQKNPNDPDAEKRNAAFAQLRREAEANRKYAEFINRLAKEGGVSPDELLARYEERRMAEEAEQKNVPVEFYKEQNETKQRLHQLEENMRAERLQLQIEKVSAKYGANDDAIRDTFKYMLDSGVDPRAQDSVDFERFYRAAHLDSIIQKEVEAARQKDLDNRKQRQESAAIPNGSSVSPSSGTDWSDEDFNAELSRLGLRI